MPLCTFGGIGFLGFSWGRYVRPDGCRNVPVDTVHRFSDVIVAWMDIALGGIHVRVASQDLKRERVHALYPPRDASVAERV